MGQLQEGSQPAQFKASPETGPFFLSGPKAMQPHVTPDGDKCPKTIGKVIKIEQYGFYNQRAIIQCKCGAVQTDST